MAFTSKLYLPVILFFLSSLVSFSQQTNFSIVPKKDTANVYNEMLNDKSDDLMENHPAQDIYNNIWRSDRLNPYKIPIDSMPDSVRIDCSTYVAPSRGGVTSMFGKRRYRYHYGIDLRVNVGDTIVAAFSGKVRIIDYEAHGYGHYVVIRHDNGLETVYAHLSQVLVTLNQVVNAGELIAYGGNTGHSTGPHLHFETRYMGNAIDPSNIFDFMTGTVLSPKYLLTKKGSFYYQHEIKSMRSAKYYTVRKGDNLSKIAARNGTSVNALKKMNKLKKKGHIKPGKRLRVR